MIRTVISLSTFLSFVMFASAEESSNIKYTVRAYECDRELRMLSTQERQRKVQGVPVRICFSPDEEAKKNGIGIQKVDSWEWETTYDGGVAKQPAVVDGRGDGMLSDIRCNEQGDLCVLDTMLTSNFYLNPGSVFGEGMATLTSGTGPVPVQKDLFQSEFSFKFTHGPGGEEMTPEETQEWLKRLSEQQAEARAKGHVDGDDHSSGDEL
mmetsp:Transcript_21404/g.34443  ORF Transcript_21404/g.34443 Transcript_21404/m.34443 type:complete len:209 (-) Transcript_21404:82-708(-)